MDTSGRVQCHYKAIEINKIQPDHSRFPRLCPAIPFRLQNLVSQDHPESNSAHILIELPYGPFGPLEAYNYRLPSLIADWFCPPGSTMPNHKMLPGDFWRRLFDTTLAISQHPSVRHHPFDRPHTFDIELQFL